MDKTIIRVSVVDQAIKAVETPVLAAGGKNEAAVAFDFCEKWEGYTKTGLFYRVETEPYYQLLDENDTCLIPWEVYSEPGSFYFGVIGSKDDVRRTSGLLRYKAQKGPSGANMSPSDPTPTVYEQLLGELESLRDTVKGLGTSDRETEGVFYIEFYGTEGEYWLASSRAEIVAAYEVGKELRCLVPVGTGVADIPLVHKTVDEDRVELRFGGSSAYLKESEGGRTVSAFIGIRDGCVEWGALLHPVVRDGKYIVNITSDGRGGYKADKTYNGVLAVHNAKVLPIECRITVRDVSYALPLCGLIDGRLIYGGSAGGLSLAVFHKSDESITVMADTLVTNMALEERLETINTALGTYIQDVDTLIGGDG